MNASERKIEYLQFTATDQSGMITKHDLKPDRSIFIGSSSNCGFQLTGPDVSQIHCHLTQDSGKLFVKDWMSSVGTRVNGQPITEPTELSPEDVLEVGIYKITFREVIAAIPFQCRSAVERVADEIVDEAASTSHLEELGVDASGEAFDFDSDFFEVDEAEVEQTYDRETVTLLRAEIEDLQATLAQRDADLASLHREQNEKSDSDNVLGDASDRILKRMQDLIDEANQSDERVSLLEELLHAAEDANRSEQEERQQLEAWVGDIESRVAQREEEHLAEVEALGHRLDVATEQQHRMEQKLKQAAQTGNATRIFDETLETLQAANKSMQHELAQARREQLVLEQRVEQLSSVNEEALREERANIAKEQAKLARMRYEISQKLAEVENLPKSTSPADQESATRIRALRHHLREIHEQEKTEVRDITLTTRLARLWKRVEHPTG